MANSYKILGQVAPSATTATAVYTVPSATETIVNTFTVVNRGGSDGTFRIAIRPDGEALANKHYQVYDATCTANDSLFLNLGWALNASDVLEVYASSADFSFTASGVEIS